MAMIFDGHPTLPGDDPQAYQKYAAKQDDRQTGWWWQARLRSRSLDFELALLALERRRRDLRNRPTDLPPEEVRLLRMNPEQAKAELRRQYSQG